jgi:RNA polymerase sigma-70 factor (ECF subfamily)
MQDSPIFPTTMWTQIRHAGEGNRSELEKLLGRYRSPIVAFLRRRGHSPEEAEDLAQEVLLRVSQPGFLEKADASKGRFRALLLAVTRHVMSEEAKRRHARKRGGGAPIVNTRQLSVTDTSVFDNVAGEGDPEFDELWVGEIVENALRELDADSKKRGLPHAEAFRLKYLQGLTQEEVAKRLECTVFNAKNFIFYGKQKFKQLVLAAIHAYCSTAEEFEAEVKRLSPYLKGAGEKE